MFDMKHHTLSFGSDSKSAAAPLSLASRPDRKRRSADSIESEPKREKLTPDSGVDSPAAASELEPAARLAPAAEMELELSARLASAAGPKPIAANFSCSKPKKEKLMPKASAKLDSERAIDPAGELAEITFLAAAAAAPARVEKTRPRSAPPSTITISDDEECEELINIFRGKIRI